MFSWSSPTIKEPCLFTPWALCEIFVLTTVHNTIIYTEVIVLQVTLTFFLVHWFPTHPACAILGCEFTSKAINILLNFWVNCSIETIWDGFYTSIEKEVGMTVTSKLYYYTIPIVVIAVVSSFTASCRIPFQSRYWQSRRTRADISLGLRPQEYISILCGNSAITIIILFSLPLISFKYLPVIYILLPFAYPEPKLDELSAVKLIVDVATSSLRVQIG